MGCCGSRGPAKKIAAEKEAYSILTSLEKKDKEELKKDLLDSKKHTGINIKFPEDQFYLNIYNLLALLILTLEIH